MMTMSATDSTRPASESRGMRARTSRLVASEGLNTTLLLVALIVVVIVFSLQAPAFFTDDNIVVILQTMSVLAIASLGQTIVIISGGFDLSVGGVIPLSGMVFVAAANTTPGVGGFLFGLVSALAVGAVVGLINAFFISKLNVNPLITTLGTMSITSGAAFVIFAGMPILLSNSTAASLAQRAIGPISWDVIVFVALSIVVALVLHTTIWGRRLYAIGGNREAVRRMGVNTGRSASWIYAWSGILAAFAGVIAASQLQAGSPNSYTDAAMSTVTTVVLGGATLAGGYGTVHGTLLGSLLLGVIGNGLNQLQVSSFYQTIITGIVLLLAVTLTSLRGSSLGSRRFR